MKIRPTNKNFTSRILSVAMLLMIITVIIHSVRLIDDTVWYDEATTLFVTAGNHAPHWPTEIIPAKQAKMMLQGTPSLYQLAVDLRDTDVHPPLHYWLLSIWRRWFGFSANVARLFSILCTIITVVAWYLLLRIARFNYPFIPLVIFVFSPRLFVQAHMARPYALALTLVVLATLSAYVATETTDNRLRFVLAVSGTFVCAILALLTHHLTLFPITALLIWFVIHVWSTSKPVALGIPFGVMTFWILEIIYFLPQLTARPDQESGFVGVLQTIIHIFIKVWFTLFWHPSNMLSVIALSLLLSLSGMSLLYLRHHRSSVNYKFLQIILLLILIAPLGMFLLNWLFDKNLSGIRYYLFSAPALAVFVSYSIIRQPIAQIVLIGFILLQFFGLVSQGYGNDSLHHLVDTIDTLSHPPPCCD